MFDLLPNPPSNASSYRFDSVAVKEPKFEIDGVFLQMTRQEVEEMLGLTLQQTRVYRDAKQEGREEGLAQERALVMRLLKRKVGEIPEAIALQVKALTIETLEELGEALLDFEALADLETWLNLKAEGRRQKDEKYGEAL